MHSFPQTPEFTGLNKPVRMEVDVTDLEVEGSVPADIHGVFVRTGPDPHYPPRLGKDIYFNGDGMVSRFTFRKGRVDLRMRYVRTDKFKAEEQAGRALFGAYRNPYFDDPAVKGLSRGTANTNTMWHGGRLLALKEDSHPVQLDPRTLDTIGNWDFDGKLQAPAFTAHPKIDPQTGEMIAFGYGARGIDSDDVVYYVIDRHGRIVHECWFKVPYPNLMHDFAVTRDYVVWPIVPVCQSLERARQGLPTFMWDGSRDVYLAVLPKYGEAKDLRLFRTGNRFCSHTWNGFNEGSKVHIDVPESSSNMFPFFPDITGKPWDPVAGQGRMTRWTIDMGARGEDIRMQRMANLIGEFPRIDDRYMMEPYRHGWQVVIDGSLPFNHAAGSGSRGLVINCIGHVDLATGAQQVYFCGPDHSLQEPQFVPKSASAGEGEGYIIVLRTDYRTQLSDLLVLDALRLADGPLAIVHLPLRMRFALHGNWIPADRYPM